MKTHRMKAIKNRAANLTKRKQSTPWYKINSKKGDERAEVFIFDEIGFFGITAEQFVKDLTSITAKNIDLRINTPGGEVFDGMAIFNALERHPANITVHIEGIAASIGGVIAMAGDTVNIAKNAHIMIHAAWSFVIGNSDDMRKQADLLDRIDSTIADIFVERTGQDMQTIVDIMDDETWLTGQEAVDAGFADNVTGDAIAENNFDLSIFNNAPSELINNFNPANDMDLDLSKKGIEKVLREAGYSRSQCKAFIARGYEGTGLRDADEQRSLVLIEDLIEEMAV